MSDAYAELKDFLIFHFDRSAFLRVTDDASSQGSFDQFPGFGNYLIKNKEPALELFSIDRTPRRIVINSILGGPIS